MFAHFDYTAFAASERTRSRKPVKSHQCIDCHYKCTQTDRPKSAHNRCIYMEKKYTTTDLSLTGLNAKSSGDNLCSEHRHKLSPGDNSCCRQFMPGDNSCREHQHELSPATIYAASIGMNCRRRQSCRATIHAVTGCRIVFQTRDHATARMSVAFFSHIPNQLIQLKIVFLLIPIFISRFHLVKVEMTALSGWIYVTILDRVEKNYGE